MTLTLDEHKSGVTAVLAQEGYTFPEPLPQDDPITHWILTTMQPLDTAIALMLTPGSRWSVDPTMLIGKSDLFIDLRTLLGRWDAERYMIRQYEKAARDHAAHNTLMLCVQYLVWARNLRDLDALELEINQKITELGA